jgi:hypothetical protein
MIETSMCECVMSIHGTEFIQSDGEVSSYTVFLSDLIGLRVNEIHCDGSAWEKRINADRVGSLREK